jgi:hypothetical protein
MRPGTTIKTSDDFHDARLVERTLGQAFANVCADTARLFERPRCLRPGADLIRMTPMLAAARYSCSSLVAATEITKGGAP